MWGVGLCGLWFVWLGRCVFLAVCCWWAWLGGGGQPAGMSAPNQCDAETSAMSEKCRAGPYTD